MFIFAGDDTTQVKIAPERNAITVPVVRVFNQEQFLSDTTVYENVDTTLDHFHYYHPPYVFDYVNLGNFGSPAYPLWFDAELTPGFTSGMRVFDLYRYQPENIGYFNVRQPYSKLYFANGKAEQEQLFNAMHTQNIVKNFNAGFDFNKISSNGFYTNQQTNHTNFVIHTNYRSADNRYGVIGNYIYNQFNAGENGGAAGDLNFSDFAVPVRLNTAHNRSKNNAFYLKQFLNFGKKTSPSIQEDTLNSSNPIIDTLRNDSLSPAPSKIDPHSSILHELNYNARYFLFTDPAPDSVYYSQFLELNESIIPDTLHDSLHIREISNAFSWQFHGKRENDTTPKNSLLPEIFVKHRYFDVHQNTRNTSFNEFSSGGKIDYWLSEKNSITLRGNYLFAGYGAGDHSFSFRSRHGTMLQLEFVNQRKTPDFLFLNYSSDMLNWTNAFDKIKLTKAGGSLEIPGLRLKLKSSMSFIDNWSFWNEQAKPEQLDKQIQLLQISLEKKLSLRSFHLNSKIVYQNVIGEQIIRLPEVYTFNSLYFQKPAFKRAVILRAGLDLFYHTPYFAPDYMPITKQFYLQNTRIVGDYPFIDIFLAGQIKSARVFVKVVHVTEGLFGYSYEVLPYYFANPRALRIGVDWSFLN